MGGPGSSRWQTRGRKIYTENQLWLNIHLLGKKGCLHPGLAGTLTWLRGELRIGYIAYFVEADGMILSFWWKLQESSDWKHVEQAVAFDRTDCYFGGQRTWFLCSRCQARAAVIYCITNYFICRKCCGLVYKSQHQTKANRLLQKARNIRKRLGGSNNLVAAYPRKPKHMHWKTYLRLCKQSEYAALCGIVRKR